MRAMRARSSAWMWLVWTSSGGSSAGSAVLQARERQPVEPHRCRVPAAWSRRRRPAVRADLPQPTLGVDPAPRAVGDRPRRRCFVGQASLAVAVDAGGAEVDDAAGLAAMPALRAASGSAAKRGCRRRCSSRAVQLLVSGSIVRAALLPRRPPAAARCAPPSRRGPAGVAMRRFVPLSGTAPAARMRPSVAADRATPKTRQSLRQSAAMRRPMSPQPMISRRRRRNSRGSAR